MDSFPPNVILHNVPSSFSPSPPPPPLLSRGGAMCLRSVPTCHGGTFPISHMQILHKTNLLSHVSSADNAQGHFSLVELFCKVAPPGGCHSKSMQIDVGTNPHTPGDWRTACFHYDVFGNQAFPRSPPSPDQSKQRIAASDSLAAKR